MPKAKLESLQTGMVVTADVKNADDMLLIPAGCALTQKQIDMLHAWGIMEIQVQAGEGAGELSDPLQKLALEARQQLTQELATIFWTPVDSNPVQQTVFDLALRRKARQLAGG